MSDTNLLDGFLTTPCDKCGGEVSVGDDVTALLVLETSNRLYGLAFSRHILPVQKDSVTVCEGSPSRAQYLEGQPRDPRSAYAYRDELEVLARELYSRLQAVAATLEAAVNR
jgi:hypothetical protein